MERGPAGGLQDTGLPGLGEEMRQKMPSGGRGAFVLAGAAGLARGWGARGTEGGACAPLWGSSCSLGVRGRGPSTSQPETQHAPCLPLPRSPLGCTTPSRYNSLLHKLA